MFRIYESGSDPGILLSPDPIQIRIYIQSKIFYDKIAKNVHYEIKTVIYVAPIKDVQAPATGNFIIFSFFGGQLDLPGSPRLTQLNPGPKHYL